MSRPFRLRKFPNVKKAKKWISQFAGSNEIYSFTAIARPSGDGTFEVILQKERDVYEKTKNQYFELMSELESLQETLKTIKTLNAATKRPTEFDSNVPKKIHHTNED